MIDFLHSIRFLGQEAKSDLPFHPPQIIPWFSRLKDKGAPGARLKLRLNLGRFSFGPLAGAAKWD